MADCHIGSWRDSRLRQANIKAFIKATGICIAKEVDFALISGDLFNTALPDIDSLKIAVNELGNLKKNSIPVYVIPGSHDFSPSGKTMVDVLENAELLVNAMKITQESGNIVLEPVIDKKTNAQISGIFGRKGMLDKSYYKALDKRKQDSSNAFRIFMFHTIIRELNQNYGSESSGSMSMLPSGFDYYAGGHVHTVLNTRFPGYGQIVFPGPIFPNSFSELEELNHGGLFIVEADEKGIRPNYEKIVIHNVCSIKSDCNGMNAEDIAEDLQKKIEAMDVKNRIVTIRLFGTLGNGRISDINFTEIFDFAYSKGAYFVMRNTSKLETKDLKSEKVSEDSVEEIENSLIEENTGKVRIEGLFAEQEKEMTKKLMQAMSAEKEDGERVADFEKRIISDFRKITGS